MFLWRDMLSFVFQLAVSRLVEGIAGGNAVVGSKRPCVLRGRLELHAAARRHTDPK